MNISEIIFMLAHSVSICFVSSHHFNSVTSRNTLTIDVEVLLTCSQMKT